MFHRIFICEDDPIQLLSLKQYVANYSAFHERDFSVSLATQMPEEIQKFVETFAVRGGIYFLDIDLGVGHINENIHNEISYSLNEAQRRIDAIEKSNERQISYRIGHDEYFVNFSQLLFLKVSDITHRLVLTARNEQTEFYGTISEYAEKYPELLQIDRSCLVNPENIVSFDARTRKLFLEDDIVLEVSRRNVRNVILRKPFFTSNRQFHCLTNSASLCCKTCHSSCNEAPQIRSP